jgi:hypothetical protein
MVVRRRRLSYRFLFRLHDVGELEATANRIIAGTPTDAAATSSSGRAEVMSHAARECRLVAEGSPFRPFPTRAILAAESDELMSWRGELDERPLLA